MYQNQRATMSELQAEIYIYIYIYTFQQVQYGTSAN